MTVGWAMLALTVAAPWPPFGPWRRREAPKAARARRALSLMADKIDLDGFYRTAGGDSADVLARLRSPERVVKFARLFSADPTFATLEEAMAQGDVETENSLVPCLPLSAGGCLVRR